MKTHFKKGGHNNVKHHRSHAHIKDDADEEIRNAAKAEMEENGNIANKKAADEAEAADWNSKVSKKNRFDGLVHN